MDDISVDANQPEKPYVNVAFSGTADETVGGRAECNDTGLTLDGNYKPSETTTSNNKETKDSNKDEKKHLDLGTTYNHNGAVLKTKTEIGRRSLYYRMKHDKKYRDDMLYVILLWWCFVVFGWAIAQFGPSFSEVRLITNTDLQEASAFLTSGSIGYLVGAFIGGALYRRVHVDLILFLAGCGLGAFIEAIPFCTIYEAMIFVMFGKCVSAGILDTVANAELIHVSLRLNNSKAYMQALHFFFAFGGILSPLATSPFLSNADVYNIGRNGQQNMSTIADDLTLTFTRMSTDGDYNRNGKYHSISVSSDNLTVTSWTPYPVEDDRNMTQNISMTFENMNLSTSTPLMNTSITTKGSMTWYDPGSQVLYIPYTMTAVLTISTAFLFLVQYFKRRNSVTISQLETAHGTDESENKNKRRRPRVMNIILLIMALTIMALNCIVEDSIANFLATFLERQQNWESETAAYATSLFWGTFCTGRFFGIFLIKWLNLSHVLLTGSCLIITSFIGLYFSSIFLFDIGIWICVAITGGAISLIFPTIFSWIEERLFPVTGSISSMLLISASFGTMVTPLALGYLMDNFTPLYFCYLPFGSNVVFLLVFIILCFLARQKRQTQYVVL